MIIAHCGPLFVLTLKSSVIALDNVFSKVFFEVLLALIHECVPLLVDLLQEQLNASLFLPVNLLSYLLAFLFICCH